MIKCTKSNSPKLHYATKVHKMYCYGCIVSMYWSIITWCIVLYGCKSFVSVWILPMDQWAEWRHTWCFFLYVLLNADICLGLSFVIVMIVIPQRTTWQVQLWCSSSPPLQMAPCPTADWPYNSSPVPNCSTLPARNSSSTEASLLYTQFRTQCQSLFHSCSLPNTSETVQICDS